MNNKKVKSAIRDLIKREYDIRYNRTIGKIEFVKRGETNYTEVNDNYVTDLKNNLNKNGFNVSVGEIRNMITDIAFAGEKAIEDDETEMYIESLMESRYNETKQRVEINVFTESQSWRLLRDFDLNTLSESLAKMGITKSPKDLYQKFNSAYSSSVNPVRDYFENLPPHKLVNPIHELAKTIVVENSELWEDYLTKWIVATCANVFITEKNTNHTMIILCGAQGTYKTTWINRLIPESLSEYLYTGAINIENKDTMTLLSQMLIINMDDQINDLLSKKGCEQIKTIITQNKITYRKPYDRIPTESPRLASFIGSINTDTFLNDPTGSRRFLPFRVVSIDIESAKQINMDEVWKQAYDLFKSGYRYYFNTEETQELMRNNEQFEQISLEEELLLRTYKPTTERDYCARFVQTSEIVTQLNILNPTLRLKDSRIFDALRKNGFIKTRKVIERGGKAINGYYVMVLQEPNFYQQQQYQQTPIYNPSIQAEQDPFS